MRKGDLERLLEIMKSYEREMIKVLSALEKANALHYCIITGSWAMYFYKKIFEDFIPRIETTDLDLYLPHPKQYKGDSVIEQFKKIHYLVHHDQFTGKTTFLSENGFEVEFLTIPDRTMTNTIAIKGMNVIAETLPLMAPVERNYIEIRWNDLNIRVVSPVSFVLQKLLIYEKRKPAYKKEKDIEAIKYVLQYIKASKEYSLELQESLNSYPKKWKSTIIKNANINDIQL